MKITINGQSGTSATVCKDSNFWSMVLYAAETGTLMKVDIK